MNLCVCDWARLQALVHKCRLVYLFVCLGMFCVLVGVYVFYSCLCMFVGVYE